MRIQANKGIDSINWGLVIGVIMIVSGAVLIRKF